MPLIFRELHRADSADALNEEWLVLENTGPNVVNAHGCALTVAKRATDRARPLGTLEPGFILKPNEKIRLVTGTPSKKSQGTPPEDKELRNYHLFLKERVLSGPGIVVRLSVKQQELARAVYAPAAENGIEAG
jgi:hypothetical protein